MYDHTSITPVHCHESGLARGVHCRPRVCMGVQVVIVNGERIRFGAGAAEGGTPEPVERHPKGAAFLCDNTGIVLKNLP